MKPIYLTKEQVPVQLRGSYAGQKFSACVVEHVTVPADAGLWSEGSRDTYRLVALATGESIKASDDMAAPWDHRVDRTINLVPGFCVIEHSIFCGRDMGLTFYVHPADAVALLPAPPADLSETEKRVLNATASLKSSYGGRDRYQMATDDLRYAGKAFPSREEWETAKRALVGRGYLTKAGAITVAGKNAL
jgi:hypothetical protein